MKVEKKKILVIGLGKSGIAAAAFLAARGGYVTASDTKGKAELAGSLEALQKWDTIDLQLESRQERDLVHKGLDMVVKSPGVPPEIPPLLEAKRLGIPVLSEVEVAYAFIKAPIIGVTGTNGKTTTTTLIARILRQAGERVHLGGNIGTPLLSLVEDFRPGDVLVTELSSFQLEGIHVFRPHISVFLNLTPDHLDYHGSRNAYLEAKTRIFLNQQPHDYGVLNLDDPVVRSLEGRIAAQVFGFSRKKTLSRGACVQGGTMVIAREGSLTPVLDLGELGLPGSHNLENSLGAVAAACCWKVSPGVMAEALASFTGVEHRMEYVDEVGGIKFVNDSKGTNPDAAARALQSYREPMVLIAGGKDKGASFWDLARVIGKRVTFLILLGETGEKIARACRDAGFDRYVHVDSLEQGVEEAYARARPGYMVLLSPACASWDMFTSFEERGNRFKALVAALGGKNADEKTG